MRVFVEFHSNIDFKAYFKPLRYIYVLERVILLPPIPHKKRSFRYEHYDEKKKTKKLFFKKVRYLKLVVLKRSLLKKRSFLKKKVIDNYVKDH